MKTQHQLANRNRAGVMFIVALIAILALFFASRGIAVTGGGTGAAYVCAPIYLQKDIRGWDDTCTGSPHSGCGGWCFVGVIPNGYYCQDCDGEGCPGCDGTPTTWYVWEAGCNWGADQGQCYCEYNTNDVQMGVTVYSCDPG